MLRNLRLSPLVDGGGTYVTGPLHLESHVFLRIVAPTVLKNTVDHTLYQPAFIGYPFQFANEPSVTGVGPSLPGRPEAMIAGDGLTDTGIIGDGTIDGSGADAPPASIDNGQSWLAMAAAAKSLTDYSQASFQGNALLAATSYARMNFPDIPTSNGLPRPWLVEFSNCKDVKVGGVLLTNSPMWNLVLRYDTTVEVANLRVLNDPNSANTDGIDPVGSQNHRILWSIDLDRGRQRGDQVRPARHSSGFVLPAALQSPPHSHQRSACRELGVRPRPRAINRQRDRQRHPAYSRPQYPVPRH